MEFRRKDLLGIAELAPEEISHILATAASLKEISARPIKKVPTLRGKTVVTVFYEPSTRTRTSLRGMVSATSRPELEASPACV